jgi:hypothetical protein
MNPGDRVGHFERIPEATEKKRAVPGDALPG